MNSNWEGELRPGDYEYNIELFGIELERHPRFCSFTHYYEDDEECAHVVHKDKYGIPHSDIFRFKRGQFMLNSSLHTILEHMDKNV